MEQFHRLCEAVPEQRLELIDGEAHPTAVDTALLLKLRASVERLIAGLPRS